MHTIKFDVGEHGRGLAPALMTRTRSSADGTPGRSGQNTRSCLFLIAGHRLGCRLTAVARCGYRLPLGVTAPASIGWVRTKPASRNRQDNQNPNWINN